MTATEMGFAPGQFDDAEEDENELNKLQDRVFKELFKSNPRGLCGYLIVRFSFFKNSIA
jgi:hypothetical protein